MNVATLIVIPDLVADHPTRHQRRALQQVGSTSLSS
jgi:hypothetical protein